MARIRTIKPEFWQSEQVAGVSIHARYLFIGLISHADDDGRLRGTAAIIRSQIYPYDDLQATHIETLLEELIEADLVRRYTVKKATYLDIPTFRTHQRINRPSPSAIPAYESRDKQAIHGALTENSLNPHGGLSVGMEGKGREGSASSEDSLSPRSKPRDELWDTLLEVTGTNPAEITKASRGNLNGALGQIRAAGGNPDDIRLRATTYRERFPGAALTATALAKHWPTLNGHHTTNGTMPTCMDGSIEYGRMLLKTRKPNDPEAIAIRAYLRSIGEEP